MPNLSRTSSPIILLVLFSVAGFAQEAEQPTPEKMKQPAATGIVATTPLPAEYDPAAWKEYKSGRGRFRILFPGTPQEETERLKSGDSEVPVRILKLSGLAAYTVMYLDSPMPLDMNPEARRNMIDSSVKQAIERFQATLLEQKEVTLDGRTGLAVKLRLADNSIMRLQLYAIGIRIYQLMVTTPPEQGATDDQRRFYDATADKFLNSFALTPIPLPFIVAVPERRVSDSSPDNQPRTPVTGGILNGKAISKPSPRYPAAAREAGVSGLVTVAVTIDEEGKVMTAKAISGPDELREAAVEAARRARFSPTRLSGRPVKVSGRLTYNFTLR